MLPAGTRKLPRTPNGDVMRLNDSKNLYSRLIRNWVLFRLVCRVSFIDLQSWLCIA